MTTGEKCENCRYYVPKKDQEGFGQCRRYPPRSIASVYTNRDGEVTSEKWDVFPVINEDSFCGEFKEKKA